MAEGFPNLLTVDVEDWFHILEVEGGYTRGDWPELESRVESNTDRMLALFDRAGVRVTCFVVGWVADRYPELVRRIADAGHELASHSYWHEVIPRHSRESLAADLAAGRRRLEDLSGRPVKGFRAPGGSITPECAWAFDVMLEAGFEYDSSLCPGYSSHGGFPSPYHGPHWLRCESGELIEIPASTVGVGRRRIPYAGGGYLRLFPYALIRHCIGLDNQKQNPTNVYVHPREIDPDQPRMDLPTLRRFKYYVGLRSTEAKLEALLRDHRFTSVEQYLAERRGDLEGKVLDVRDLARRHSPTPDAAFLPPPPPVANGDVA